MNYLKCYFCKDYITDKKSNLLNHLNKQKKCSRTAESYNYTDEELYNKSCQRIYIKSYKKDDTIYVVPLDFNTDEEDPNQCIHCCKILSNKYNLIIHYKSCKLYKDKIDKKIILSNDIIIPISFEENWDLSEIDIYTKTKFLVSNIMYTSLLKKILENKKNQNIVIENNTNSGLVYINGKYITMKMNDIFKKTMEKLYKQIIEIINEIINKNYNSFSLDVLDSFLTVANKKIVNYRKNIDKEYINNFIKEIFNNIKSDAIKIMIDFETSLPQQELIKSNGEY
jgi:hypothetical protein